MYPYYYGFDPTMILLIPAMLLAVYAQTKVKTTFNKYLRVYSQKGYTGAQVARYILDKNGLRNVDIELTGGRLSDHYDPRSKVLRLSNDVYHGTSIASVSVAAHEVGHAIQHGEEYFPLTFRNNLVPIVNISSSMSWIFIMLGFLVTPPLLKIGILLFSGAVLFQVVTLPVEFNASSRAIDQLVTNSLITTEERKYSKKVLDAAALTYVAAAASAIMQLIRLVILSNSRDD
ncbi:zinc metallopeptidase [Tepidibacter hydrothermalis]|uniref:Zinc metallopeptidase n=1 Tax=Tepidibacter hydrothermalis TaxID=3036126 RepID=A0ABY8EB28_9FIRM|nr:zinc metallopeptidase [Tepidibacter hydrothermalis]WFD09100.1 zinc metallopeptidase [Tepidibacter hydrothermalis]